MVSSTILGLNIGYFSYLIMKMRLYWQVAMPLAVTVWFVSRNSILRNCMDRIYYPCEEVYKKLRSLEKQDQKVQNQLQTDLSPS